MRKAWPRVENVELVQSVVRSILLAGDPGPAVSRVAASLSGIESPIALLSVGKGAVPMARALLDAQGDRVCRSLVVTTEHPDAASLAPRSEVFIGDHPLASRRNLLAAERVREYVRAPEGRDQFLLVLLSGGASALLTLPVAGISLDELTRLSASLMRAGCPIDELNCVRKHCERLKGGRLAALSSAMRTRVLVLSDVIGDPLSTIASGPMAPDPTTFDDAMNVLTAFDAVGVSPAITEHLRTGMAGSHEETLKPGDPVFDGVTHEILLSNADAVRACESALASAGFRARVLAAHTGEAQSAARDLAKALHQDSAVIMGGEPVVSGIQAGFLGGPMQEAVLGAALALQGERFDWLVLGCATDGRDGPTDAAGAAMDSVSLSRARAQGIQLESALLTHHTHPALDQLGSLIRTGPTGTNINDVLLALRW